MSSAIGGVVHFGVLAFTLIGRLLLAGILVLVLKVLYNISPFHPLAKYPGPLLWRATRLVNSYHHASGDLYQHIAAIHEKYGKTVRIAPDELSFTSPEAWPEIYNSRPQLVKSSYHFGQDETRGMPVSMITAPDQEHTRLRRLAGPAFLNAGIAEVEPTMQRYSDLFCTQLKDASNEGSQNMVEWLLWMLNDVIGQLALDQEFGCLEKRRLHEWPAFLMHSLKISAAVNQFKRFGVKMRWLAKLTPKAARAKQDKFFHIAKSAVDTRLAREDDGFSSAAAGMRPDIIGLMLRDMKGGDGLSDDEILVNSILIVAGGSETTATTLTSTFYHLCKFPAVMANLQHEIRSAFPRREDITLKAIAALPYLKAVIDENLRIFPTASFITPRLTPKDGHVIDGNFIPANTYVSMGQWFMGRSDRFFDNPQDFRPERWINSEVQKACGRRADEILRPFSLGPRNCVGKLFALAETRLVLAKLIWSFDFALDGDHATWVEDARFYILWELQPLKLHVTPVQ